jgi:hypothetical protein
MDPLDHLVAPPGGLRCTVCEERVPATRIRLLARRDDLVFLEIDCGSCLSATLGFILDGRADEPAAPGREPISTDDVLDMHELLASWQGDLTGLLSDGTAGPDRPGERGSAESSR